MKNKLKNNRAFTLVELIIAVALFTLVAFISIGAILSVYDANKRAQASKTVVDNLNLSIENMARMIRFGSSYYCGISSSGTSDCPTGGDSISVTFDGSRIIYKLSNDGKAIQKKEGGGNYENITSPETVIQYLRFYVFGSSVGDANQPYIIAVIKGYSGNKLTVQSEFSIETLMSRRKLDI